MKPGKQLSIGLAHLTLSTYFTRNSPRIGSASDTHQYKLIVLVELQIRTTPALYEMLCGSTPAFRQPTYDNVNPERRGISSTKCIRTLMLLYVYQTSYDTREVLWVVK